MMSQEKLKVSHCEKKSVVVFSLNNHMKLLKTLLNTYLRKLCISFILVESPAKSIATRQMSASEELI